MIQSFGIQQWHFFLYRCNVYTAKTQLMWFDNKIFKRNGVCWEWRVLYMELHGLNRSIIVG
jgi:hypothetical protein